MREHAGKPKPGHVTIENVNHPGAHVHGGRWHVPRDVRCDAQGTAGRGAGTEAQMRDAVVPHLPDDLFPGGAKAGWWSKAVQLDLEAKGVIARESSKPLRWYRNAE